jgi:hypothetical protein
MVVAMAMAPDCTSSFDAELREHPQHSVELVARAGGLRGHRVGATPTVRARKNSATSSPADRPGREPDDASDALLSEFPIASPGAWCLVPGAWCLVPDV